MDRNDLIEMLRSFGCEIEDDEVVPDGAYAGIALNPINCASAYLPDPSKQDGDFIHPAIVASVLRQLGLPRAT